MARDRNKTTEPKTAGARRRKRGTDESGGWLPEYAIHRRWSSFREVMAIFAEDEPDE